MPEDLPANSVIAEDFAARLEALDAPRRVGIAVSGGRDSMALAVLCSNYAKRAGAEIVAFTVDHGLRDGSAETARQSADWCEALGIPARILNWHGEKPPSGIQAAARKARYGLLAKACNEAGIEALLTAHSASDQAETMFMRLRRGAGAAGLAAMADHVRIASGAGLTVRLLRPLLPFSREQLTATAKSAGQAFFDDPANDDPTFERVRVRALLAALEEQSLLSGDALAKTAARLHDADARLRQQEQQLFTAFGGCFHHWGGASLDRIEDGLDQGAMAARLIHAVNGQDYPPDAQEAAKALFAARKSGGATISGALIRQWNGRFWFMREPAAVLGRNGVKPMGTSAVDGPTLWDGRFILRPTESGKTLSIGPLGRDLTVLGVKKALFHGPDEGLMSSPVIYREKALITAADASFQSSDDFTLESLARERFMGGIIRF